MISLDWKDRGASSAASLFGGLVRACVTQFGDSRWQGDLVGRDTIVVGEEFASRDAAKRAVEARASVVIEVPR